MHKLISAVTFLLPVLAFAHADDFGPGMMGGWNMMGWGGFGFWAWIFTLTWIVWLIVGILIIVWLWRRLTK